MSDHATAEQALQFAQSAALQARGAAEVEAGEVIEPLQCAELRDGIVCPRQAGEATSVSAMSIFKCRDHELSADRYSQLATRNSQLATYYS